MSRSVLAGAIGAPFIGYLAVSYIKIDWFWVRGMFSTWSDNTRGSFLLVAVLVAGCGACLGAIHDINRGTGK